jgi:hypothetical protein
VLVFAVPEATLGTQEIVAAILRLEATAKALGRSWDNGLEQTSPWNGRTVGAHVSLHPHAGLMWELAH